VPADNLFGYKGKFFNLKLTLDSGEEENLNANPDNAKIFKLKIGNKTYYYFFCGGEGFSGRAQYYRFCTIFSDDLAPITIESGIEYPGSFCDLNNDGNLDFIEFETLEKFNEFKIKTWTLKAGKFVPLKSKFDHRFFNTGAGH